MAKILTVEGEQKELTNLSLKSLQEVVGGYIEIVKTPRGRMIVNEEGLLAKLPVNLLATALAGQRVVGNVVLLDKKDKV